MDLLNAVIDLSHHNVLTASAFHEMKDAGIQAIIHKATEGIAMVDREFVGRRTRALSLDFLWGAYHFGTNGEGVKQADAFLKVAGPHDGELMVLDWENKNSDALTMNASQAAAFVMRIHEATGRYPTIYSNQAFIAGQAKHITRNNPLAQCPLWIARYGSALPFAPAPWKTWVMWQYTDGVYGEPPHACPGVVGGCDRDKFNPAIGHLGDYWKR